MKEIWFFCWGGQAEEDMGILFSSFSLMLDLREIFSDYIGLVESLVV